MPMIPLDRLTDGHNARVIAADPILDGGLQRSIAALGVLQPLLVRMADDGHNYEIVLGHRRAAAARAVGLTEVPAEVRAMDDAAVAAAQLAENVQRADMHPVDQWRAVRQLHQDLGMSFEAAAEALGLSQRATRRMERLGRLHPDLLALAVDQLPREAQLRVIAGASLARQAEAIEGLDIPVTHGQRAVPWDLITARCETRRISRALALFDPDTFAWDEDLFTQPGSDDQFTTSDTEEFLRRQNAALAEKIAGRGKRHEVGTLNADGWSLAVPPGFRRDHAGDADRLKRGQVARWAIRPNGEVRAEVFSPIPAKDAAQVGALATAPENARGSNDTEEPGGGEDEGVYDDEPAPVEKPPFSKAGLEMIWEAKSAALAKSLANKRKSVAHDGALYEALHFLMIVATGLVFGPWGNVPDFASTIDETQFLPILISPAGHVTPVDDDVLTGIALQMMDWSLPIKVGQKPTFSRQRAMEWIGAAVNADAFLPRFDTQEFLATMTLAELRRAYAETGRDPAGGTAAQLRELLKGKAPKYRPALAAFGAPGPRPASA